MSRRGPLLALLLTLAAARSAGAQDAPDAPDAQHRSAPIVRYGKWGAAALFAAFTAAGAIEHNEAEVRFRALESWCISVGPCMTGADGRYTSPEAESQYQAVIRRDKTARAWFVGGQLALGGAAVLFVVELLHQHGPPNVPYSGLVVKPGPMGTTNVGWRIRL